MRIFFTIVFIILAVCGFANSPMILINTLHKRAFRIIDSLPHQSRVLLNKELELSTDSKDPNLIFYASIDIAAYNVHFGQFDSAEILLKKRIEEFSAKIVDTILARCYSNFAELYLGKGELDKAFNYQLRSLKLYEKLNQISGQVTSLYSLGSICLQLKQTDEAHAFFSNALDLTTYIKNPFLLAFVNEGMGAYYYHIGKFDQALQKYKLACSYHTQVGNKNNTAICWLNIGNLSDEIGLTKQSIKYYRMALGLFKKIYSPEKTLLCLINLAATYHNSNQYDSAIFYFNQSEILALKIKSLNHLSSILYNIGNTYKELGNYEKSVEYHERYEQLHDSIINIKKIKYVSELDKKYQLEKKELALKNEKQLSASRKTMNTALLLLALILALLLVFMWRNFRQQKKIKQKESELDQANALLQGQDAERERIARELHDRVGSMLSTVKLQFTGMETQMGQLIKQHSDNYQKAIHLLDETYEEVRRISHDLDTGLLGRYGLRTAMEQLTQLISSANKLQVRYIDNDLSPEIYKPFETELYRITQELLSNTIKYASASEVSIQISRTNGNLVYSYEDDGVGFSKQALQVSKGLGYKNIEARVNKMKGSWHLDTSPDNGVNLIIEIPLAQNKNNNS